VDNYVDNLWKSGGKNVDNFWPAKKTLSAADKIELFLNTPQEQRNHAG